MIEWLGGDFSKQAQVLGYGHWSMGDGAWKWSLSNGIRATEYGRRSMSDGWSSGFTLEDPGVLANGLTRGRIL